MGHNHKTALKLNIRFLNAFHNGEKNRMRGAVAGEAFYRLVGRRRAIIGKFNTANFFTGLYAGLIGGRISRHGLSDIESVENGFGGNALADIVVRDRLGIHEWEVKAFNMGTDQAHCSARQAGYFFSNLLWRIAREKMPSLNYAFFKYGTYERVHWGSKTRDEILAKLCDVKYLLDAPSNLLLALFSNSPRGNLNHTAQRDGYQSYFHLRTKLLHSFVKPGASLDEICPEMPYLMLNELRCDYYASPRIEVNGMRVREFPIARYFFRSQKAEKAWLKSLKANYKQIFEGLQIPIPYSEEEIPF